LWSSGSNPTIFIQPDGATAWRVLETDETIPLATTFAEFIKQNSSNCTLPSGQHQEFLILGPIATSWLAKRGSDAYFLPFPENDVSYYSLQKNNKIA
jgi:hypothetical protein